MRRFGQHQHAHRQAGGPKQADRRHDQEEDGDPQEEGDAAQEGGRSQVCFGEQAGSDHEQQRDSGAHPDNLCSAGAHHHGDTASADHDPSAAAANPHEPPPQEHLPAHLRLLVSL